MAVQSIIHKIDGSMTKLELQTLNLELAVTKQEKKRVTKMMVKEM